MVRTCDTVLAQYLTEAAGMILSNRINCPYNVLCFGCGVLLVCFYFLNLAVFLAGNFSSHSHFTSGLSGKQVMWCDSTDLNCSCQMPGTSTKTKSFQLCRHTNALHLFNSLSFPVLAILEFFRTQSFFFFLSPSLATSS